VLAGVASPVVGAAAGANLAGVVGLASPVAAAAAAAAVAKAEVEGVAEVVEPVLAVAGLALYAGQAGDEPGPQVWAGLLFSQPLVKR